MSNDHNFSFILFLASFPGTHDVQYYLLDMVVPFLAHLYFIKENFQRTILHFL